MESKAIKGHLLFFRGVAGDPQDAGQGPHVPGGVSGMGWSHSMTMTALPPRPPRLSWRVATLRPLPGQHAGDLTDAARAGRCCGPPGWAAPR